MRIFLGEMNEKRLFGRKKNPQVQGSDKESINNEAMANVQVYLQ